MTKRLLPKDRRANRPLGSGLATPPSIEDAERIEFHRLKLLSRKLRTLEDVLELKRQVSAWVTSAPSLKARQRRRRWAQAIAGAFAHVE